MLVLVPLTNKQDGLNCLYVDKEPCSTGAVFQELFFESHPSIQPEEYAQNSGIMIFSNTFTSFPIIIILFCLFFLATLSSLKDVFHARK